MPFAPALAAVPFDLLVLIAPADQPEASSGVLAALPAELSVAALIATSGEGPATGSSLENLRRQIPLPLHEAGDGTVLAPGGVYLTPPHTVLEMGAGAHSTLTLRENRPTPHPLDRLLASLATRIGARALLVVLGGEGRDGLDGARDLRGVGATVLVQRSVGAAGAELPQALVDTGTATLGLSPGTLGQVVADLLGGDRLQSEGVGARQEAQPASVPSVLDSSATGHRALFNALDEGVCLFERLPPRADGQRDYRYLAMNTAMLAMFGIPDLSGKSIRESFPDEAEDWYDDYDRVLETGTPIRLVRESLPQGKVLEMFVSRMEDGSGQHLLAVMRDVTDRKRLEEARHASEKRLHLLVNATSDMVYRMSADWSEMYSLEGKSVLADTERPSQTWLEGYIPDEEKAFVQAAIDEAIRHKTTFQLEHRVFLADGRVGWTLSRAIPFLDEHGEILEWFGAASDITERKRTEAALRESEERQAFLLKLSDILQRLTAPNDIKIAAMHILGTHLGVSRAQYHEVDCSGKYYSADGIGYADGLPLLDLKYRIGQFGSFVAEDFEAGRPFRSGDLLTDPRPTADEQEAYGADQIRAGAGIPLLRAGKLVAILAVHDMHPHPWTDLEMELIRETAERVWAAKVRTEIAVLGRQERQAFLLMLSDRLRLEVNPRAIAQMAVDLLAGHLRLDRAYVAQVDRGRDLAEIGPECRRPDLSPVEGVLTLSDFPDAFAQVEATTLVLADTAADPALSDLDRQGFAALRMGALMVASARKGIDNPVWALVVAVEEPRHWTAAEVALLEEVAARTWAALERARAEETVREGEEKYRSLFEEMDEGFALCEVVRDADGQVVDYRYLDLNPALVKQGGFTPDALRGRRATEAFPNLDPWLIETYARVVNERQAILVEHPFPHVNRWMRLNAFPRGGDRFAVLYSDISERKRAEEVVRAGEERQAFLLKLSDTLRPLADPLEIQAEAARVVGNHFGAGRASYAEVEPDDEHFTVHNDYIDGVPSYAGRYRLDDFGPEFIQDMRGGRTVTMADAERDARVGDSQRALYTAGRIGAFIGVPLVKGNRLVAVFSLHHPAPRLWPAEQVALVEEVAERTWAAVERARAEAALSASESRLRALIEHLPGSAVFVVDHDLRYQLAQGEALTEAGLTPEVLVGRTVAQAMPPALVADHEARYRQALAGNAFEVEHETQGRIFITRGVPLSNAAGKIYAALAVSYDITDRKRAEELMRVSEARLSAVFEALPVGVGFVNPEGKLLLSNQELQRFLPTGLLPSRDAERQPRWAGFDAGGQRVEPRDFPGTRALRGERVVPGLDMLYTQDNGAEVRTRVSAVPLRDASGQVTGQVHVVMDVNALKRAEEELRALNAGLEERVEERTHRLADLNVELGNVIIRTARNLEAPAEVLGRLLNPGRPLEELAPDLHGGLPPFDPAVLADEVTRLRGVAQDLRELSALERHKLNLEFVPLRELFAGVQVPTAGRVEWLIQPLPIVRADQALLRQALEVLMTFTLSRTRGTRFVTVDSREVEGEVQIAVNDDGAGLSPEEASTLFDLAVRTDQSVPVLEGSGLAQVRRILARHGGWAWAESRLSGGKVVLAFPRDEEVTELERFLGGDHP
ncbi:PAS domain-containing protein [Deinococcus cavernae]|nr:PAS domain-containing protein [Deinococcus cavernae]